MLHACLRSRQVLWFFSIPKYSVCIINPTRRYFFVRGPVARFFLHVGGCSALYYCCVSFPTDLLRWMTPLPSAPRAAVRQTGTHKHHPRSEICSRLSSTQHLLGSPAVARDGGAGNEELSQPLHTEAELRPWRAAGVPTIYDADRALGFDI